MYKKTIALIRSRAYIDGPFHDIQVSQPWQRLLPSSMIFDSKQKVLGGIFGGESDVENAGEPFGSGSMAQFSRGALLVASSTRFPVD